MGEELKGKNLSEDLGKLLEKAQDQIRLFDHTSVATTKALMNEVLMLEARVSNLESQIQSFTNTNCDFVESIMPSKISPDDGRDPKVCFGWNDYNRELRLMIGLKRINKDGK